MAQQEIFRFSHSYSGRVVLARILWENVGGTDIFTVEDQVTARSSTWKTRTTPYPPVGSSTTPQEDLITAGLTSTTKFCTGNTLTEFVSIATFPYAQRVDTPNSSQCSNGGIVRWGIWTINKTDETLPGEEDGTISGSISTFYPVVYYELLSLPSGTSVGQNKTGSFSNLPPGQYRLAVQDTEEGYYLSDFITILPGTFDVYGSFIQAPFKDIEGRSLLLNIRKKNFSGTVREVCLSSNPVTYAYKGTQTDWLFSTIYGYSLDFQLKGDSLRDLSVLYTNDDREYLVELTRDAILLFRGYLLPEFIRMDYVNYNNFPVFTVTDGLGQLKLYKFLDNEGKQLTGKMNLQSILEFCLNKVNLGFKVYNSIKWRYKKDGDTIIYTDNLLEKLYIDVAVFYKLTSGSEEVDCAMVVSEILKTFFARLFQYQGNFLIETPYNYFDTSTILFTGKSENLTLDMIEIAGNAAELKDGTVPMIVISPETSIEIEPGAQLIRTIANLQPTDGLLPYPEFGKIAYSGDTLKSWSGEAEYAKPSVFDNYPEIYNGLTLVNSRTKEQDIKFIRHFPITLEWSETLSFMLVMRFKAKALNGRSEFKIFIRWGSYYLNTTGTAWVLASPLQNKPEQYLNYIFTTDLYDEEKQIEIQTPLLPDTGNATEQVQIGFSELWALDSAVSGQISPGGFSPSRASPLTVGMKYILELTYANIIPLFNGSELPKESIRSYQNPLKFTTQVKEIELSIGQRADDPRNAGVFYPYGFFDSTGFAITQWVPEDESEEATPELFNITEMVQRTMIKDRRINREALDASIIGDIEFFKKILMSKDNNLIYFITDLSGEFKTNTHSARLIYSEGDFILDRYKQDEETAESKNDEETDKPKREENYLYDEDFILK